MGYKRGLKKGVSKQILLIFISLFFSIFVIAFVSATPQWQNNQTNSTIAGTSINHSVNWTDDVGLANYTFSFDNGTGIFVNDTPVIFTGTQNFSNVVKVVNSTAGTTIQWRVYANDSSGNENVTDIFTYTTTDEAPKWQDNQTNSTIAGQAVNHRIKWTDNAGLDSYTFSFDNGAGIFVNDTPVIFTGTQNFSNVVKVVNSTAGTTIQWRVYANDSSGNENVTDIFSYTTVAAWNISRGPISEYDVSINNGRYNSLVKINDTHYVNVFTAGGVDSPGFAIVLEVLPNRTIINKSVSVSFDPDNSENSLVKINDTHYINTYRGTSEDGFAVVLEVNLTNFTITNHSKFEFDTTNGLFNSLVKINDTHYMNVYQGSGNDGIAAVLEVLPNLTIIKKSGFIFDSGRIGDVSIVKINDTHYFVATDGDSLSNGPKAFVLEVNLTDLTVSKLSSLTFGNVLSNLGAGSQSLVKINDTHYLDVYIGLASDGFATVLEVNPTNFTITNRSLFEFETDNTNYNSLVKINDTHYMNVYFNESLHPVATILQINSDLSIVKTSSFRFDTSADQDGHNSLVKINNTHYINIYAGQLSDTDSVILNISAPGGFQEEDTKVCVNDTGTCFSTVQEAINNATAGQTVVINDSGTYQEQIKINKSLTLTHNSTTGTPTLLAVNNTDSIMNISNGSINVTVRDIKLSNIDTTLTRGIVFFSSGFESGGGVQNVTFRNITFNSTNSAGDIFYFTGLINDTIIDNVSAHTEGDNFLFSPNSPAPNIRNLTINQTTFLSPSSKCGLDMDFPTITNMKILNSNWSCPVAQNGPFNLRIGGNSSGIEIRDSFLGSGVAGITFRGRPNNFVLRDVILDNVTKEGVGGSEVGLSLQDEFLTVINFTVRDSKINSTGSGNHPFGLFNNHTYINLTIQNNTFSNPTSTSRDIIIKGNITNMFFRDSPVQGNINFTDTQANEQNITLLNTTYTSINQTNCDGTPKCNITVKWYLDVGVNSSSAGAPISGASVNISDVNGNLLFSGTTNSSGKIERQNITEFEMINNAITTFQNTAINASASDHFPNSTQVNVTSSQSFFVILSTSTQVTLNSPDNDFLSASQTVTFNATASDDLNLTNVTLYGNWTGSWVANVTNSSPVNGSAHIFTINDIPEGGGHIWNVEACDNSSNCVFALSNRTFTVDLTTPRIDSVILNATSTDNLTTDNLTAYPQNPVFEDTLIYNWKVNGQNIAPVIMPFDTNISTNASDAVRDYAGDDNNGTLNASGGSTSLPTWTVSGISGGAYEFNSTFNQSITINSVSTDDKFTVSAWVKNATENIFGGADSAPTLRIVSGNVRFHPGFGNDGQLISNISIEDNEWHHIVGVRANPGAFLYVDGILVAENSTFTSSHPATLGSLGRRSGASFSEFFNGTMDEAFFYNRSLSHEQVIAIYNNGTPRYNVTVSEETSGGDVWSVDVTPNNQTQDGITVSSNNLTIASGDSAPTVTLNSPANTLNTSSTGITFNATASDDLNLTNVTLYANFTGTWAANETNSSGVNNSNYIFSKTLAEGRYIWNIQACDNSSQCSFGTNNRTLTVDLTAPTVALPEYTNATQKRNDQQLTLNISVTDTLSGTSGTACLVDVNGTNQTLTFSNGWCNSTAVDLTGLSDGNQTIRAYANDSSGNFGLNDSFAVWIDTTAPVFTDIDNQSILPTESLSYDINATDAGVGLGNFSINDTGNFSIVASTGVVTNATNLSVGFYVLNVTVNDTLGNLNSTIWTVNVSADTGNPSITIHSPTGTVATSNVTINISFSDSFNLDYCSYNITNSGGTAVVNDTNITCGINSVQYKTISDGSNYVITAFANDTSGNENVTNGTFNVDTSVPDSGSGGGGGGGSGGGGGAAPTTNGTNETTGTPSGTEVHKIQEIYTENTTIIKNVTIDVGIKQIQIEVNNRNQNITLNITKYDGKPTNVSVEKDGIIYRYLQIETDIQDLKRTLITSKVEKSWISDNNIDKNSIILSKFNERSSGWEDFSKTGEEEDTEFYYYDSEITSFSFFAISGLAVEEPAGENLFSRLISGIRSSLNSISRTIFIFIILAAVLLLLGTLSVLIIKNRAPSKKQTPGPSQFSIFFKNFFVKLKTFFTNRTTLIVLGVLGVLGALVFFALRAGWLSSALSGISNLFSNIDFSNRNTLIFAGIGVGLLAIIVLSVLILKSGTTKSKPRAAQAPSKQINLDWIKNLFLNKIFWIITGIILLLVAVVILALTTPIFGGLGNLFGDLFNSVLNLLKNLSRIAWIIIGAGIGLIVIVTLIVIIRRRKINHGSSSKIHQKWAAHT